MIRQRQLSYRSLSSFVVLIAIVGQAACVAAGAADNGGKKEKAEKGQFELLTDALHETLATTEPIYFILAFSILILQALVLRYFGQPWISKSGKIMLFAGDVFGPENSQQIMDWYTFSHILHGVIFYGVQSIAIPQSPIALRLIISMSIEAAWEMLENSPIIIGRYRETALASGYSGDSILNSICDSFSMTAGFYLAHFLPVPLMITLAIGAEVMCAIIIRDNLTLNVIQLIHPWAAISAWQAAGNKNTKPAPTAAAAAAASSTTEETRERKAEEPKTAPAAEPFAAPEEIVEQEGEVTKQKDD